MTDTAAIQRLRALPRAELGHWPTPLHRVDRFSAALGVEVWLKRDDVQGVALAGNKIRKFELVLGQALADGCDTLVTTGATQSNSARTGAAAARAVGMDAILLLSGDEPEASHGNLLLDRIVGADIRFAGEAGWRELNDGVERIVADLAADGRKGYAAPVGCSSPLGSLGFALAFLELVEQMEALGVEPSALVHTSTSGGTHAGLLVGRSLLGSDLRIVAVDAGQVLSEPAEGLAELANRSASLIGHDAGITAADVEVDLSQLGAGYGIPTDAGRAALDLLATTESVVVDPVYSSKGLAGLVELARNGLEGPVVFWHTGGYHALFDPHYGTAQVS